MKTIKRLNRKVNMALLAATLVLGVFSCKKGTFDINSTNPNSPSTVPPKYTLSSSLAGTANLMFGGNEDIIDNWMGYWTQSGAYTPSNTFVLYQMTSGTYSGNWDAAYTNLENYSLLIKTASTSASLANYKAVGMIMTAFVYQRLVDLYNNVPYSNALSPNNTFSYKYDSGSAVYKAITAKIDSAIAIISANSATAEPLGKYDVMFNGSMTKWTKFAKTLKLKILMRQTASSQNGSLGDAGVKAALASYTQADFLGAGEDAVINPGYSNASNAQENPLFLDVVANAQGAPGINQKYFRANAYAVNFYKNHNDPRMTVFYYPNDAGVVQGRVYGSQNGNESNSVISAITAFGRNSSGAFNGPTVGSPIIPAFESLFLQAEAIQRGYIAGSVTTTFNAAVSESFRYVGVPGYAAAAAAYTSQADPLTNITVAIDPITTIITQKWAACNGIDPLESFSDYRRLGIPAIPVSVYPGVTVTHIPYRLPYPTSELNYNAANVPAGGSGTDALTSKIFWQP